MYLGIIPKFYPYTYDQKEIEKKKKKKISKKFKIDNYSQHKF